MLLTNKFSQKNARQNNNDFFVKVLTLIFFSLGAIAILNHAMWRDELNVWLITRDSLSVVELFQNIKYEGHPSLWYLCLYILNQFTNNPVAMQIFHLAIATTSIYIFTEYSPFTNNQKILFSFGYFSFYEYLLISRNYAIGILFVFLFCACFASREKSYILLAVILAFMANTNAFCLFIAVALGLTLLLDYLIESIIKQEYYIQPTNIIASITIFCFGAIASLMTIIPPADSTLQGGLNQWIFHLDWHRLTQAIARIWNGYIVILIPGDSQKLSLILFSIITFFLVAFIATIFIRKPLILFFYLFSTLEIVVFNYIKTLGVHRHYGHHYIILIASLWLASYYSDWSQAERTEQEIKRIPSAWPVNWIKFVNKRKKVLIAIILYAQLAGGLVAFIRDLRIPYSAGRETVNYIKSQDLEKMFIVGSRDANMAPISGYLNQKLYYPERQALGSFTLFNSQRKDVDADTVLEQVSQLIKQKNNNILLILNYPLDKSRNDITIAAIASFTESIIPDEKYYLYKVKAK